MEGLILAWAGLLGACVGSFTNVVAWRLIPRRRFPVRLLMV
ncbi:prepilin peptidase [Synechococcus sp. N26]|nr:prepilin peptidase [Synechococcus sp. N26]